MRSYWKQPLIRLSVFSCVFLSTLLIYGQQDLAVVHSIRLADAEKQIVEIQSSFPTGGKNALELVMPVWAPGYYSVENFGQNVIELSAQAENGKTIEAQKISTSRWSIPIADARSIRITYRLKCERCSVVTNWIGEDFAVFNGPATFLNIANDVNRPQVVRIELPDQWQAFSGLESFEGNIAEFHAPDYDTLIDSPILAGKNLGVHEFEVAGVKHVLVNAGEHPGWDGAKAAENLSRIVQGMHDFWGPFPFKRYVFLNIFNNGGGGLEHLNSTLISTRHNPNSIEAEPWSAFRWLAFVSHEYFHAFNVKRLRPVELGPFDYERPPRTPSLWISEGLTSYYGDLIVVRSGLAQPSDFLSSMSSYISQLQNSPGRRKQTLEQASLDVWTSGTSGVTRDRDSTVSYYVKGPIVGFLLDAKIRQATGGVKCLDDVMRLAYSRYSGPHGFSPANFVAVAEEVAGIDLDDWFKSHLATTDELDYSQALAWFGLEFSKDNDPQKQWNLNVRADATPLQQAELQRLLSCPSPNVGTPNPAK